MRKSGAALAAVGAVIVIYSAAAHFYALRVNNHMIEEYEKIYDNTETVQSIGTEQTTEYTAETVCTEQTTEYTALNINGINISAMIEIPSISLKAAIGEGVDSHTLKYCVGHFTQTPMPENGGNFCLAAHRSNVYGKFFSRLEEVDIGDDITIIRNGKSYTYCVCEKSIVEPNDISGLYGEENSITLYTCTKDGKKRVMVKGLLINPYSLP